MKSWVLVLILGTPGTPATEHYVSIVTPDKPTCLTLRDRYFTYAETHTGDETITTMYILKKRCVEAEEAS